MPSGAYPPTELFGLVPPVLCRRRHGKDARGVVQTGITRRQRHPLRQRHRGAAVEWTGQRVGRDTGTAASDRDNRRRARPPLCSQGTAALGRHPRHRCRGSASGSGTDQGIARGRAQSRPSSLPQAGAGPSQRRARPGPHARRSTGADAGGIRRGGQYICRATGTSLHHRPTQHHGRDATNLGRGRGDRLLRRGEPDAGKSAPSASGGRHPAPRIAAGKARLFRSDLPPLRRCLRRVAATPYDLCPPTRGSASGDLCGLALRHLVFWHRAPGHHRRPGRTADVQGGDKANSGRVRL